MTNTEQTRNARCPSAWQRCIRGAHLLTAALLLLAAPLLSQTSGENPAHSEFGQAPPDGSGFVRVVSTLPAAESGTPESGEPHADAPRLQLGPRRFRLSERGVASPYRPVPAGEYPLEIRELRSTVTVKAGGYQTVAITRGGIGVFRDEPPNNPRLAQLVFYNLSDWRPLDLTVIPQDITAIQAVPRGGVSRVAVNPIQVTFGVRESRPRQGRTAGSRRVGDVQLQAGASFSIFAFRVGKELVGTLQRARVISGTP